MTAAQARADAEAAALAARAAEQLKPGSGRAVVLSALLSGCTSRDEIIAHIAREWPDFGVGTTGGQRFAVVAALAEERTRPRPLWSGHPTEGIHYKLTAAGKAQRPTPQAAASSSGESTSQSHSMRFVWTDDLHALFERGVKASGGAAIASPRNVLEFRSHTQPSSK